MSSRPLDQLSPESRAVLSLVLLQARSYSDIADLLRLSEDDVRERVHTAARQLASGGEQPDAGTQARLIDYVLGEQSVSERADTRSALLGDDVANGWARRLVAALTPLASTSLPTIPRPAEVHQQPPAPESAPEPEPAAPPSAAPAPERATTSEMRADPKSVPPTPVARPVNERSGPGATRPVARRAAPWLAVVGLIAVAVVVVLLASGGGSSSHSSSSGSSATTSGNGATARTSAKLIFQATGGDRRAGGSGSISTRKGVLLLLLRAHGLAPNKSNNAYGVWLFNSSTDAKLLGFVTPPVGAAGTFSSGSTLPSNVSRFHSVIVTVETTSDPSTPGPQRLRAALSLS